MKKRRNEFKKIFENYLTGHFCLFELHPFRVGLLGHGHRTMRTSVGLIAVQRTVPRAGSGIGTFLEPCSIILAIDCRWYMLSFVFQRYCQTSRMRISLFNFTVVLE